MSSVDVDQQARADELARRLAASEAQRTMQYERLTSEHDRHTLALLTQIDTLTAALSALCDALTAEEAHRKRPVENVAWYCSEGQRLRDETRRCRERSAAVLSQERES